MKKVKFFIKTQIQMSDDFTSFEDSISNYLSTLAPQREGFPDMDISFSSSNTNYNDILVMVTSYDE